jgi:hypothetical protein
LPAPSSTSATQVLVPPQAGADLRFLLEKRIDEFDGDDVQPLSGLEAETDRDYRAVYRRVSPTTKTGASTEAHVTVSGTASRAPADRYPEIGQLVAREPERQVPVGV